MEVGKRLVSPDLRLYIVADPAALRDLVKALELGWVLGGNLQQLWGWGAVDLDRDGRDETCNWQRLDGVQTPVAEARQAQRARARRRQAGPHL